MTSFTLYLFFIPVLAVILLAVNFIFATYNPNAEKRTAFECGFHSFLGQNRSQFSISFFIFALLFLLFYYSFFFLPLDLTSPPPLSLLSSHTSPSFSNVDSLLCSVFKSSLLLPQCSQGSHSLHDVSFF